MADEQPSNEEWRPVVGYEGYSVSSLGRVRGKRGRVLSPSDNGHGYLSVPISGAPRRYVHQLVLEAFSSPRPVGHQARHLNGNRGDNRIGNLSWGTVSENARDKRLHGTDHYANRGHCPGGHEFTEANTRLRYRGLTADGSDVVRERVCIACEQERSRKRTERRREARPTKVPRSKCRRGHDITGANGLPKSKRFTRKDGTVGVSETIECRICNKAAARRAEAKRKAKRQK